MNTEADIVERLLENRGVLDNRWPGPSDLDKDAAAEITKLRAERDAAARDLAAIRSAVSDYLDGNYGPKFATKHDQCPHGRFEWENCGNCIDDHFSGRFALIATQHEGDVT